jgi:ADP-ribose pyrophosphatase
VNSSSGHAESGKTTTLYRGRIIDLNLEEIRLPGGETVELEIVRHPGGAAVVALDEAGRVCLLKQYRHAAGGWLWELPAGKIDAGEQPDVTARRELEEEAGVSARDWVSLGRVISSPGVFTEVIHLYLARGLRTFEHRHEPHEVIAIHWVPYARALEMAMTGAIIDGKTLVGLCRAQGFLAPRF